MKVRWKACVAGGLAVAAFAGPAQASAFSFHGTAVHRDARLHAWVVAGRGGAMRLVHTSAKLRAGSVVTVQGRLLADRSISASKVTINGRAHRARLAGTVVRHSGRTLTVASHGAVVTVWRHATRRQASALDTTPTAPTNGSQVVVSVSVDQSTGELDEDDITTAPGATQGEGIELSGTVVTNTPGTTTTPGKLVVQLDDGQGQVFISVPAGTDVSALTPGMAGEFRVSIAGDTATGENVLTFISFKQEDQSQGDDNQGDDDNQGGDHQGGGDQQGSGGQQGGGDQGGSGGSGGSGGGDD